MKSLKVKLVSIVSAFILALSLLIVGVWAVGEAKHINLSGNVNFTISDNTLYIKDIRVREAEDLTGQGTTIDNFLPGFVNGDIDLDLGERTADTSFTLLFDVINTTTTEYRAGTVSTIPNATLSVSGTIAGDGIAPSEITNSTPVSGTILMTVTVQSAGTVSLDGIVIDIEEDNGYTVTIDWEYESAGQGTPGMYADDFQIYLNNSIEGTSATDYQPYPNQIVIENVKTINFGNSYSIGQITAQALTPRVVDSYQYVISSEQGFSATIHSLGGYNEGYGSSLSGWFTLTENTHFTVLIGPD